MTTVNALCGAVTPVTAVIAAKVTGSANVRVAYTTDPDNFAAATYSSAVATANNVAKVPLSGLTPDTRYYYQIEDNGVLDPLVQGQFYTHPPVGEPCKWTFVLSGDSGLAPTTPGVGAVLAPTRISNHVCFDTMRTHSSEPRQFVSVGDATYYDIGSGVHVPDSSLTTYRRQWDDILLQPRQQSLYLAMPLVYVWDDHDYGPNNSDSTSAGHDNACTVYRERIPSYDLADPGTTGTINHSYTIGRTLYIVSDTRSARDPDGNPDIPGHTMLGESQVLWFENLLETTTAEFIVWIMPTPWLGTSDDSWGGFATERDRLAQIVINTGWSNRMIQVTTDVHTHAISSAGGNPYGGFPVFLVGSIDSTPSSASGSQYDGGYKPSRNQYAIIEVNDTTDQIACTVKLYTGLSLWKTVTTSVEIVIPPDPLPPVPQAIADTDVTWIACDLSTGIKLGEYRDIKGSVSRALGQSQTSTVTLPIPLSGPGYKPFWRQHFQKGRTLLVLIVNQIPIWAGIVLEISGGTGATLSLSCMTPEGYFNRRFVRDHVWTNRDTAGVIVRGLIGDAVDEGIALAIDSPTSGYLRSRTYYDQDDATVYSRLVELMEAENGIEWTVDAGWRDDTKSAITLTFRVRERIGVASDNPLAVFTTHGLTNAGYTCTESYADGYGANAVIATGAGESVTRPQSPPVRDAAIIAGGMPRYESRISPANSESRISVLTGHAQAEINRIGNGTVMWELNMRWDAANWGTHWQIGDDVRFDVVGHMHPDGATGVARVIGYTVDTTAGVIVPMLRESVA